MMIASDVVHVRCLARLHTLRRESGQSPSLDVEVPQGGTTAMMLAQQIGLPTELIEGVFLNNRISGMNAIVRGGDRIAFVPPGTPASHPSFFGDFVTRS